MDLQTRLSDFWEWMQAPIRGVGAVIVIGCIVATTFLSWSAYNNSKVAKNNSEAAKNSSAAAATSAAAALAYGKANHQLNMQLIASNAAVLNVVNQLPEFKAAIVAGQALINAHFVFEDCLLEHPTNTSVCGVAPPLPVTTLPAPPPAARPSTPTPATHPASPAATPPTTTTTGTTPPSTSTSTSGPRTTTTTTHPCKKSHRPGCP